MYEGPADAEVFDVTRNVEASDDRAALSNACVYRRRIAWPDEALAVLASIIYRRLDRRSRKLCSVVWHLNM